MVIEDEYLTYGANYFRLCNEYQKYGSLVVGFDFDGTVHDYHKTGGSYEKVIQLLKDLKSINCKLICWTAYPDLKYVEAYLSNRGIPFDGINTEGIPLGWESKKPFFSALLDDRAGLRQAYQELSKLVETFKDKNI